MDDRETANPGRGDHSACEFDADALRLKLDTTIQGVPSAIPPVVERIMTVVAELGCAHDQEYEIRLALSEALANAVLHGCHGDPDQCVQIGVECDPERGMLIVVRDPGPGFDPSQVPSPIEGEQIFRDRGRGIFLISQLMREVSFNRRGTEIRMRPHTGPSAGGGKT
ncbi:MAG: ATP-binding protein [Acidobacteriota bacterium]